MSAPGRPVLTDDQAARVAAARAALADSIADEAGNNSLEHQAVLEYRLGNVLELVDELAGGAS